MKTPRTSIAQRRRVMRALGLMAAPAMLATPSQAQEKFPSRPITFVVPFAPGGGTDIVGRVIQQALSERLGQPVLVVNRPGAAGVLATNVVAKSPPDGYTLFLSWDSHAINPIVHNDLPYDTFKDFAPVTLLARVPQVMGAWAGLPVNNVAEFVAYAKQQPGKLNYASVGLGSSNHLMSENFDRLAGIDLVHVPYKGGGPSILAMVTGEVSYSFLSYASMRGNIQSGKLKALAVTASKRIADIPDVPTMAEAGFPGFEEYAWIGVFAPAGTPAAVINRLNRDCIAALSDKDVQKRLADSGVEPVGSTPSELDAYVRSEHDKWARLVKDAKIKFE